MVGSLALLSGRACSCSSPPTWRSGFTFSTVARNQLQAMQMAFFFFLPSILLSGFMFPFRGMPAWAQWLGEVLPLTHFLRIVRGILLKGNGVAEIAAGALADRRVPARGGDGRAARATARRSTSVAVRRLARRGAGGGVIPIDT